jgi:hypothetical protein
VFDVGSYHLNIQSLPVVNQLVGGLLSTVGSTTQTLSNTLALNSSFLTAQNLTFPQAGSASHFHAAAQGSINSGSGAEFFRFQAPPPSPGANVLTVTAFATLNSQLLPNVTIYDADHNLVPAQVLANENGTVTVQVLGTTPGATYYAEVSPAASSGAGSTGAYTVAVDFGAHAVQMTSFVNATLTEQAPQQTGTLAVQESALFHFVLSADANDGTGVTLTIRDASGAVVRQISAAAGTSVSTTLTLPPATYTFAFTAFRTDGKPVTGVNYQLQGVVLSAPQGPQPEDPTSSPSQQPPSGSTTSGSTTTSNTSSSSTSQGSSTY